MNEQEEEFQNPIDPDKVTENPGTLAYPHHAGSAPVVPNERGQEKSRALSAMYQQTDRQLKQIEEQIRLLAAQAKAVQDRIEVSKGIYAAEIGFDPLVGHIYHLYRKEDGRAFLSMLSPSEWGRRKPFETYVASARLLADHTWELLND